MVLLFRIQVLLLLLLLACLLVQHVTAWTMSTVERVPVQDFNAARYYKDSDSSSGPRPLVVTGVLSAAQCETACDALMSIGGELNVDLQNQNEQEGTELYPDVSLTDALDTILYESSSRDAFLAFCEGLLEDENVGLQDVHKLVTSAREGLFTNNNDPDWFTHYFPAEMQPSDAVVLAGAGATSTLHRDPFEWTGTSLCLEGSKVWRFIDPKPNVEHVDEALESYRLESIAWQGASTSAGWQSNLSLFKKRKHDLLGSAREWSEMEDETKKLQELSRVGACTDLLRPEIDSDLGMTTAIQQAGDLLLIPAHWWHQTYALEPSAAIASQRCGNHDSRLVLQHILNHGRIDSTNAKTILASQVDPAKAVEAVLALL